MVSCSTAELERCFAKDHALCMVLPRMNAVRFGGIRLVCECREMRCDVVPCFAAEKG